MPKMSERDKHQELEVRLKAMTEQVETSRKRLRERQLDYAVEIKELDAASQRKILKDNAESLNVRQPA